MDTELIEGILGGSAHGALLSLAIPGAPLSSILLATVAGGCTGIALHYASRQEDQINALDLLDEEIKELDITKSTLDQSIAQHGSSLIQRRIADPIVKCIQLDNRDQLLLLSQYASENSIKDCYAHVNFAFRSEQTIDRVEQWFTLWMAREDKPQQKHFVQGNHVCDGLKNYAMGLSHLVNEVYSAAEEIEKQRAVILPLEEQNLSTVKKNADLDRIRTVTRSLDKKVQESTKRVMELTELATKYEGTPILLPRYAKMHKELLTEAYDLDEQVLLLKTNPVQAKRNYIARLEQDPSAYDRICIAQAKLQILDYMKS